MGCASSKPDEVGGKDGDRAGGAAKSAPNGGMRVEAPKAAPKLTSDPETGSKKSLSGAQGASAEAPSAAKAAGVGNGGGAPAAAPGKNGHGHDNDRPKRGPSDSDGNTKPYWPNWLTKAAGSAVEGWKPRSITSFQKISKIGQGTYSSVYKAVDLENGETVALKKVRFDNLDPVSIKFMAREIQILRQLDHPNVVKLLGIATSKDYFNIYLVFEFLEHDLTGLAARPDSNFSLAQIKCYMKQILTGLKYCHEKGVLHRDIKASNMLLDNNGQLKLADFGLAAQRTAESKEPLTTRVITLWYRPPELLLGATTYDSTVDLWSVGCILAELLLGKPPLPGRTEVEQLHKIFKLCGSPGADFQKKAHVPHSSLMITPPKPYPRKIAEEFAHFAPEAIELLDLLLALEPKARGTAAAALHTPFFTTAPLPMDPALLPKYPSSHEYFFKKRRDKDRREGKEGDKEGEKGGAQPKVATKPAASTGSGKNRPVAGRATDGAEVSKQQQPASASKGGAGAGGAAAAGEGADGDAPAAPDRQGSTGARRASYAGTMTDAEKNKLNAAGQAAKPQVGGRGAEGAAPSLRAGSSSMVDRATTEELRPSTATGK